MLFKFTTDKEITMHLNLQIGLKGDWDDNNIISYSVICSYVYSSTLAHVV